MDDGKKTTGASAKDKVVKPQTETKVKDARESVTEAAQKAKATASEQVGKAKGAAGQALNEAKAEAKTQLAEAKGTAQAKIQETKQQAQTRAKEEVEARKAQATSALSTTAEDLRRASEVVEESWMTKALSTAASSLEDFTQSLDNKSPQELQAVAQRTAREHPGLFLAGCFAAGVAISRTLRVAQSQAQNQGTGQRQSDYQSGYQASSVGQTGTATSLPPSGMNAPSGAYGDRLASEGGTTGTTSSTTPSQS